MKKLVLAVALAGLTACQTTRYAPVHCIDREQYKKLADAEPEKVGSRLTGRADEDVSTIAGNAIRLRAWGRGLLGVLEGCAK